MRWFGAIASNLIGSGIAFGHEGKPHHARDLLFTWGLDPLVLASLALAGWLYVRGIKQLWGDDRTGRGIKRWEAASFSAGWLTLFVALVSPLHPLGGVLFSAHMTQHELLMLIAAPLIVLGKPVIAFLWATPLPLSRAMGRGVRKPWFQRGWQWLTKPLHAWAIHAFSLWVWHIPLLFQATLSSELVHTVQHIFFLGSALLFWWSLIHSQRDAISYGAATLYLFTTSVHSGVLGALITFARNILYPAYSETTLSWGLTPLEDQQLGGLIMWIPAGLIYIVAGLALCAGWIRQSEQNVSQTQYSVGSLEFRKRTEFESAGNSS